MKKKPFHYYVDGYLPFSYHDDEPLGSFSLLSSSLTRMDHPPYFPYYELTSPISYRPSPSIHNERIKAQMRHTPPFNGIFCGIETPIPFGSKSKRKVQAKLDFVLYIFHVLRIYETHHTVTLNRIPPS